MVLVPPNNKWPITGGSGVTKTRADAMLFVTRYPKNEIAFWRVDFSLDSVQLVELWNMGDKEINNIYLCENPLSLVITWDGLIQIYAFRYHLQPSIHVFSEEKT